MEKNAVDQKFKHLTKHVELPMPTTIYSSRRTNIMYSTIRLYTTEVNAKALDSAERIGWRNCTDCVAKMVVVLELLTTLSIKKTDRS